MAFYSDEIIEEVKAANDIVDVVSGYVQLKRSGNNYFGLCPFHREKTPSFSVAPEKQIYHCFGCGKGGNVVRFIMDVENISFAEAIEMLADRAKIELPHEEENNLFLSQDELLQRDQSKKNILAINKLAGRFFYENIQKSKQAQEYIQKRAIQPATVRRFGLGFALEDNGLTQLLQQKGFPEKDMIATGLVGKTDAGRLYDKFKNRFMFPIFDIRGNVVAFGGRCLESAEVMKAQRIPKYMNSPENIVYIKGRHLYALNLARKSNEKMKRILVVEGYMDVVSPHQAGITNVVASLGTALTEQQGRLLRRYADEIILSYDADAAGQNAIERGLEVLRSLGISAKVLQMSGAKDPDEFILKYGPERFQKLMDDSISYAEYKIRRLQENYHLDNTTEKIQFLTKMAEVLAKIDNNIERDIYIEKFSKELGVGKEAIQAEIEKKTIRNEKAEKKNVGPLYESAQVVRSGTTRNEDCLIYLLSKKNESVYQKLKDAISIEKLQDSLQKKMILKLYELYNSGNINTKSIDSVCDSEEELNVLTGIMMQDHMNEDTDKILNEVIKNIQLENLTNEKNTLMKQLANISTNEESESIAVRLNEINEKLGQLMIR